MIEKFRIFNLSGSHMVLWLMLAVAMALPGVAGAEAISFEDCWGAAGFNLQQQDNGGVEIVFSVPTIFLEDQMVNGERMKNVMVPGIFLPNNAGAPNLPGASRYVALPKGARAELEILAVRTEVFHNLNIAPAYQIPLDTDPVLRYNKDLTIYNRNANYPERPILVSDKTNLRGVDAVMLGITPFQYNPVTKDLTVYKDVRVRVNFIGGSNHFGEDRLRSPWWDPLLEEHLLNYTSLPTINYTARSALRSTDETNVEYLIIVPDDPYFIAWADSLKRWRNEQGIRTGISTLTEVGGNTTTAIENYVNNAYNNWQIPPVAVLLLSDYQSSGDVYGITSPLWNSYCVSDNIYADVNGDNLPEMTFGRITAQTPQHLQTMIGKMLSYERSPSTNPTVYQRPLIAGGWQSDRWFILCCEVIYGYFQTQLGKTPIRQYAGASGPPSSWSTNPNTYMIINYFGPSPGLGYIPATPSHLTDWTGSATGINAAINAGTFMVQHRDHGELTGWSSPSYHSSNLTSLTNSVTPFVFSMNCLTGKYNNSSEVFTEAFHRMNNGALGVTAASEVSYSFVNDAFTWGMYDCMWPNFDPGYGNPNMQWNLRPGFAMASGKYYLQASSWPYNPGDKTVTQHLFHHHGDAFITMYSEVPQNLTVLHQPVLYGGMTSFTVTANVGSWIGLSVNGVLIGAAEGTGGPVNITIPLQTPGTTMRVTVTKSNYFRYMTDVQVIPPSGPYVIYNSCQINDAQVGNNNGQWDYNEMTDLSVGLKNIGVAPAPNVTATLSESDPLVTVLDSTAAYGTINAGDSLVVPNGFRVQSAGNTPDQHSAIFTVTAVSGTSVWTSNFICTINAPQITKDTLVIQDTGGNNNGLMDPGETATFLLTMINAGHSGAQNVAITMTSNNPQVTISGNPASYGNMGVGVTTTRNWTVIAAASIPQQTTVTFTLNITGTGGYVHSETFDLIVGDIRNNPTGPDAYGYRAYDRFDAPEIPAYQWVEISADSGGLGTLVPFTTDDGVFTYVLPFSFCYYGSNYDSLTVGANGWVAPGVVTADDYSNSGIPNTDGPERMIAAYWEDLSPQRTNSGKVWYWFDQTNHRYIVEYNHIEQYAPTGNFETFQVILLDPAFYPTSTGDGRIKVQYKDMSAAAQAEGTVGIENPTETIGLQFFFDGAYNTNAYPIVNHSAILYTTPAGTPTIDVTLTPINPPIVIPAQGGSFEFTAQVANTGSSPATFNAWIMQYTPLGQWQGPMLGPLNLTVPGNLTISRQRTQNVPSTAPAGQYIYRGYVGQYSAVKWDSSSFTYTKSADMGSGPEVTNWANWGESFAPYENVPAALIVIPEVYSLGQCRPNPFNPATTIGFGLPQAGVVTLKVFDISGRVVSNLVNGWKEAGVHEVTFDGSKLASGLYFYQIQANDFEAVKKMMLVK